MPKARIAAPTERAETRHLIGYAFDLARNLEIQQLLVLAELIQDRRTIDDAREEESIIWVARGETALETIEKRTNDAVVEIPDNELSRMDQIKLGLVMSVLKGTISADQSVICLAGAAGSKRVDTMLIANPKRDFSWFADREFKSARGLLASKEFARLLEISLKFANEGREGKPLGAIFVLGSPQKLKKYTRPLILNPLKGHTRAARQIQNEQLLESLRELASLDGAIIVDRRGVVTSAGVYLNVQVSKSVKLEKGLGARHTAAAAISSRTDAIAIAISESSGKVSVFSEGSAVLEVSRNA